MPISRNVRQSSFIRAATAFLISRSRRRRSRRLAISLQGLISQLRWLDRSVSNEWEPSISARPVSSDGASVPVSVRLVSLSGFDPATSGLVVEETIAIVLRRSCTVGFSAFASIGAGSTREVVISFSKVPYAAPYNAKPSVKNVNIDDQGPAFRRSARMIAGIAAGREFTAPKSSRGEGASWQATNEGNGEDWRFGNMRFSVNWHGDSDGCRLRDHHRRVQYGYNRNCAAPHFHHFLERFDRQREQIADVALGLDYARCTRIDLQFAPAPQHLDLDAPIENIFVNSGGLKQMLPRQRPLGCCEKGKQQGILALAQRDRRRGGVDESSATPIKLPAVESIPASL